MGISAVVVGDCLETILLCWCSPFDLCCCTSSLVTVLPAVQQSPRAVDSSQNYSRFVRTSSRRPCCVYCVHEAHNLFGYIVGTFLAGGSTGLRWLWSNYLADIWKSMAMFPVKKWKKTIGRNKRETREREGIRLHDRPRSILIYGFVDCILGVLTTYSTVR